MPRFDQKGTPASIVLSSKRLTLGFSFLFSAIEEEEKKRHLTVCFNSLDVQVAYHAVPRFGAAGKDVSFQLTDLF